MAIKINITGPSSAYGGALHCYISNIDDRNVWSRNVDSLPELIKSRMLILRAAGRGVRIPGFGEYKIRNPSDSTEAFVLYGLAIEQGVDENFYPRQYAHVASLEGEFSRFRI